MDARHTDAGHAIDQVDRWEHRTVYISRAADDWEVVYGDGTRLTGLDRILDEYGARSWELVSFVPHAWKTQAGQFGPFEVTAYRAVFKRRVRSRPGEPA